MPVRKKEQSADMAALSDVTLTQIPPGANPAVSRAGKKLNIQLNGGVIDLGKMQIDPNRNGNELVLVERLNRTVNDPVKGHMYPSDDPVEVSYSTAITFGLKIIESSDTESSEQDQDQGA